MKLQQVALFVLMLVVTPHAVAEDQVVKRSDAEKKAIAAIKKLGGKVTFAEKKPGKPVISVYLTATKVTDAGLVHLKGLSKLQMLSLSYTKVTDAGVKKLQAALPKCKISR